VTYGGLDLLGQQNGACPRFGASHLRLRPAVIERAEFSYGAAGSAGAGDAGLAAAVAGVLETVATTSCLLGRDGVDVGSFARVMLGREPRRPDGPFAPAMGYSLDDYIEAQMPGPVDLAADAEAIVIDPAYAGSPTADALLAAARRHGLQAMWHPGCVLPLARIPTAAPRGPGARLTVWQAFCAHGRARRLAERVAAESGQRDAEQPYVDAEVINTAAASAVRDPPAWRSWGEPPEILRSLKLLWLLVVVYGRPPAPRP
jgi:hypothetical protein